MNMLEEAIIYATIMHQGKVRKFRGNPFILHPIEVAQILSTMTEDDEVITAGILHDLVEDTDGTLEEIEKRFGKRVAQLVDSESEKEYPGEEKSATWKRRKEESLMVLKNSQDIGVQMLWLADKLANIRFLSGEYSERGEAVWQNLHQSDPAMHCWYYKSVAEIVELQLNKTGAFKELIIKVFNRNNTYRDVEREIALSRKAFILGIPTAISFGIVSVGERYGAMYELVDSETISRCIARNPGQVGVYAKITAELARAIHATSCIPAERRTAADRHGPALHGASHRGDQRPVLFLRHSGRGRPGGGRGFHGISL